MHFLFESIIVGCYLTLIFVVFSFFIENLYIALFLSGFVKHFLGFYIGLHDYFCRYGDACQLEQREQSFFAKRNTEKLLVTSFIEGCIVLGLSYVLCLYVPTPIFVVFLVGVLMHLFAEYLMIHRDFCINECGFLKN